MTFAVFFPVFFKNGIDCQAVASWEASLVYRAVPGQPGVHRETLSQKQKMVLTDTCIILGFMKQCPTPCCPVLPGTSDDPSVSPF